MSEGSSKYQILLTASDQTREAFESAKNNTTSLTDKLEIARGAFAAVAIASATAVAVMIKGSIDAADAMSKASQKVGTTTEMLSGLKYAAELSDVSFESLQKSLGKLSSNAYKAATAGGEAATAFTTLGVNVKGTDGHLKDSGSLLEELAGKFAKMPDSAEKSAIAIQLFGKAGLEMIPLLNSGADGLKKMRDEAEEFGVIIDGEVGKRAEEFNDNLTRISERTKGIANQIMSDLIPALNEVMDAYMSATKGGEGLSVVSGAVKTTFETIVIVATNTAYVFKQIGLEATGMATQLVALAHLDFKSFTGIGDAMKKDAEQARKELDDFEQRILNPPKREATDKPGGTAPDLDTEKTNKALEALLQKAKQMADELVISHESAFDKIVTKYVDMDQKLSAAGVAGAEARKQIHVAFEAFLVDEQAKREVEMQKAQEKENETNNKLVETQQEKFTKMREMADQATLYGEGKENARFEAQMRATDREKAALEAKGAWTIALEESLLATKESLYLEHEEKLRIATLNSDKKIVDGKIQYQKMSLDSMGAFFGMAKGLMNSNSRAAFEIGKAAAISETVINTYKSATGAYSAMAGIPYVGPALGVVAAAAAIASGMAQVSAIQSASFGSAGGGSYGGATSATSGGAATPNYPSTPQAEPRAEQAQPIQISIYNTGTFVDAQAFVDNTIIPQIRDQISNSDVLLIDPRSRQAQVLVSA